MNFKKVLVTGGLGQIGSYVVELLLKQKITEKIVILDNRSSNKIMGLNRPDIEINDGDINNNKLLNLIFTNHKIDRSDINGIK